MRALAFEHPKQELLRSSGPSVRVKEQALDMAQAVEANKCRAVDLKLLMGVNELDDESLYEDEDALWEIARRVRGIVVVPQGEEVHTDRAKELAAKIRADYEGIVLRDRIWDEKPVRGPFGEGTIELKPVAVPKKQRAIQMTATATKRWWKW